MTTRRIPDLVDFLSLAGVALLWWGLDQVWAPLAPIVVGTILLATAAVLATRHARRP